jgi:hypothetical protein
MDDDLPVVVALLDKHFDPNLIATERRLDARNVSPAKWNDLLSICQTHDLRLYHLSLSSLAGIERLRKTRTLALECANRVTTLRPVFNMSWLEKLSVTDFPKLEGLDGIEDLQNLSELHLSGNRGSLRPPLHLKSIAPVAKLPKLERFSLAVARLDDDDITSLATIRTLRHLQVSNQFDRVQFAYLAKHLNGQLDEPIGAYRKASRHCVKCGGEAYMFIGRRAPFLCRTCDAIRFERLTGEFEALAKAA